MSEGRGPYSTKRGGELARLRVDAGMTQDAAADQLQIKPGSLSNIERGAVEASETVMERMAEAYGRPVAAVRRAYLKRRRQYLARR